MCAVCGVRDVGGVGGVHGVDCICINPSSSCCNLPVTISYLKSGKSTNWDCEGTTIAVQLILF